MIYTLRAREKPEVITDLYNGSHTNQGLCSGKAHPADNNGLQGRRNHGATGALAPLKFSPPKIFSGQ